MDSFESGKLYSEASFVDSTAWASHVASKPKERQTYGRRGSDITSSRKYVKNTYLSKNKTKKTAVTEDGFQDYGIKAEVTKQEPLITSPYNSTKNEKSNVPTPPPRQIKKWKTISGQLPVISKSDLPPRLMRS